MKERTCNQMRGGLTGGGDYPGHRKHGPYFCRGFRRSFSPSASPTPNGASGSKEILMGTLIVGLISLALLVYLIHRHDLAGEILTP